MNLQLRQEYAVCKACRTYFELCARRLLLAALTLPHALPRLQVRHHLAPLRARAGLPRRASGLGPATKHAHTVRAVTLSLCPSSINMLQALSCRDLPQHRQASTVHALLTAYIPLSFYPPPKHLASSSQAARAAASVSTSYAFWMSMNSAAALGLSRCLSGCLVSASLR